MKRWHELLRKTTLVIGAKVGPGLLAINRLTFGALGLFCGDTVVTTWAAEEGPITFAQVRVGLLFSKPHLMICSQTTLVIDAKVGPGLLAKVRITFGALSPFGGDTVVTTWAAEEGPITFAQVRVGLHFSKPHLMICSQTTLVIDAKVGPGLLAKVRITFGALGLFCGDTVVTTWAAEEGPITFAQVRVGLHFSKPHLMICSQTTLVIDAKVGPGLLAKVRITFGALSPFGGDTVVTTWAAEEGPITFAQVRVGLHFSKPHLMICSQTTLVIGAKVGPGLLAIVRVTFGARGPFGSATLSIHELPVTFAQVTVPLFAGHVPILTYIC